MGGRGCSRIIQPGARCPYSPQPTHRRKTLSVSTTLKSIVKRLPIIKEIVSERDELRRNYGFVPPGHFYSPVPSLKEIRRDEETIFGNIPRNIPGIEMHESEQLSYSKTYVNIMKLCPSSPTRSKGYATTSRIQRILIRTPSYCIA